MLVPAVFFNGLGMGASLIMAIGAQNAHVLRMGVERRHVGVTVAACIAVDIVLIAAGVAGMGALIQASPLLLAAARWGGAAFLAWYGLRSWAALWRRGALDAGAAAEAKPLSWQRALLTILALSLLNPHVYLDTLVLLGALGGHYAAHEQPSFAAGAMVASLLWFTLLGYGAQRLSGWLRKPSVWKGLEALTGAVMLTLAAGLVF